MLKDKISLKFIAEFKKSGLAELFSPRPYSSWKNIDGLCVYGYLREVDDQYGKIGTLYYIGEGTPYRVIDKKHTVIVPSPEYIIVFADNLDKSQTLISEEKLINHYGRIICDNGVLENIKPGGDSWGCTGTTLVRDPTGKISRVPVDDFRIKTGELTHPTSGTVPVKYADGTSLRLPKDHPDFLSGKAKHPTTGTVVVKLEDGTVTRISKTHPDYVSGKLVSISKGMVTVYDKDGNKVRTSMNDQRILSGELINLPRGVQAYDKNGIKLRVAKDDPRLKSGELINARIGMKYKPRSSTQPKENNE